MSGVIIHSINLSEIFGNALNRLPEAHEAALYVGYYNVSASLHLVRLSIFEIVKFTFGQIEHFRYSNSLLQFTSVTYVWGFIGTSLTFLYFSYSSNWSDISWTGSVKSGSSFLPLIWIFKEKSPRMFLAIVTKFQIYRSNHVSLFLFEKKLLCRSFCGI